MIRAPARREAGPALPGERRTDGGLSGGINAGSVLVDLEEPGATRAATVRRRATGLALDAAGATFRHPGGAGVEDVTLRLERGETVALMGASGSGKTTLLKVLAGLRPLQSGRVVVCPDEPRRRGMVGYIPQQLGLVRSRTALENVLAGALARGGPLARLVGVWPREDVDAALALLERVGLGDKADRKVASLSGGERQRVAIARALLQDPCVLLADEFTANLDVVKAGEVLDLLTAATGRGAAAVIALHNVELAREYCDRVLVLRAGRVHAELSPAELTRDEAWRLLG